MSVKILRNLPGRPIALLTIVLLGFLPWSSIGMTNYAKEDTEQALLVERSSSPVRDIIVEKLEAQDKVKLELFVMSQCPFGIRAEQALGPILEEFGDKLDFTLYFIASEDSSGGFISLHGQSEVEEDIRQVVMAEYYPDKYFDYILARSDNFQSDEWEQLAADVDIDPNRVNEIASSSVGSELFRENIKKGNELGIPASPTLLIDEEEYTGTIFLTSVASIVYLDKPGGSAENISITPSVPEPKSPFYEYEVIMTRSGSQNATLVPLEASACPTSLPGVFSPIKDPKTPSKALCRGACGTDCDNCREQPPLSLCFSGPTGEFSCKYEDVEKCGTHPACRAHDGCYDYCAEILPGQCPHLIPVSPIFHCCRVCDLNCVGDYSAKQCDRWRIGEGPFDGYKTFVANPIHTRCTGSTPYCADGECVECRTDTDCSDGEPCVRHNCVTTIVVTSASTGPDCTLPDAITAANTDRATGGCPAGSGADLISLEAPSSQYLLTTPYPSPDGPNGLPSITTEIIIKGNGATIERQSDPTNQFRIFHVASDGKLTLDGVVVKNGYGDNGGGIYNRGVVILAHSQVLANEATQNGGGIYNSSNSLVRLTEGSKLSANKALRGGGGIYNHDITMLLDSTISSNSAPFGGGILNDNGSIEMINSTVGGDNTASIRGGGIFNDSNGILDSFDSFVTNNKSFSDGAGIFNNGGIVKLINSSISGNAPLFATALIRGGGIFNASGIVTVTDDSVVSNNRGASDGGGIFNSDRLNINDSTISRNEASSNGAGIFNDVRGTAVLTDSIIHDNSTGVHGQGGGIYNAAGIEMQITNSTISDNSATTSGQGGGIFNTGKVKLTNSTVGGRNVAQEGGGIYDAGEIAMTNSTVSSNLAASNGGGIYHRGNGQMRLLFNTLSSNIAHDGGGIYVGLGIPVQLGGTIISKQISGGSCFGNLTSFGGYNLISSITNCRFTPASSDQWGTDDHLLDPVLGELKDNGGPTFTHALMRATDPDSDKNSPAIDAIPTDRCPEQDQRGEPRLIDIFDYCDIGAFERQEEETAIDLLSFTARPAADRVTLSWETGTEVDNAGFNLWRAMAEDGPYTKLNDALIPAEGDPESGASYTYTDTNVVKGVTYYYKLEDVDIHGVGTFHGPVSATPGRIHRVYLPLVLR